VGLGFGVDSVRNRLFLAVLGILVPIVWLFWNHGSSMQREILDNVEGRHGAILAKSAAVFCVDPMLLDDYPVLESYLEQLTAEQDTVRYAQVLNSDGKQIVVVGDAAQDCRVCSAAIQMSYSGPDGLPIELGTVSLGLTDGSVAQALAESRWLKLLELLAMAIALFVGLAAVHGWLIGRPLAVLDRQAQRLARGDLQTPVEIVAGQEFGRLANTLDTMRVELAQSDSELREQNQQLRDLDQLKSSFLATMSHEIRTPLNGIMGFTQSLAESELDPSQRESVDVIARSADTLMVVLNDILDWSKMEADRLDLDPHPTQLSVVIHDLAQFGQFAASGSNVSVVGVVADQVPPWVLVDGHRLRQVLHNLVGNAMKFTAQGQVTLEVEFVAALGGAKSRLRFSVRDQGIGIPASALEHLFEPFRQADSSHSRSYGGTGLGLAICDRLVEALGGTLEVESVVGEGSTFSFELELASVADASTSLTSADRDVPTPPSRPLRVLVAEDNDVNRLLLERILDRLGAETIMVVNGQEAVDAFAASERGFDLVLMDCQMPKMDGMEATRQIRAREDGQGRVPIVAVTANATAEDRLACIRAGMDDFLVKPIRLDALRLSIERWTRDSAAAPA